MSGIKYEVLAGDDLISALRGGRTGDLLDDAAYAAADEIERLQRVLQKVMARCADLLDEDQFNELDAMTRATVTVPVASTNSPEISSGLVVSGSPQVATTQPTVAPEHERDEGWSWCMKADQPS